MRAFQYQWEHLATGHSVYEALKIRKAEADHELRGTQTFPPIF